MKGWSPRLILMLASTAGALACDGADDDGDRCAQCSPDEVCVQDLGGVCQELALRCVPRAPACAALACDPACDLAYCQGGDPTSSLTCAAADCTSTAPGVEVAGAFHCYGP